ncbi:hypothetical protein EVAR_8681_1 [Eumeta japonica]|uniref:Mos1 transposase HTH domain-containing protein n=1 Tax=Eumeta variegata TaxID=151549 RepID=A0A4C1TUI7_EUMVA|nr:hypothetical protein EVAR_8681_1 [Eumeta japonica]
MTIYKWFAEFKRDRVNLSDEFRGGRPSTAVNNNNIDAVRRIIEADSHVTYNINTAVCLNFDFVLDSDAILILISIPVMLLDNSDPGPIFDLTPVSSPHFGPCPASQFRFRCRSRCR